MTVAVDEVSVAALDAALERAFSRAPIALRALLVAAEHGGGDIGVRRLALRVLPELDAWEFGASSKIGRASGARSELAEAFADLMLGVGGRAVADASAGDNPARKRIAIALAEGLAKRGIAMRPRLNAAE